MQRVDYFVSTVVLLRPSGGSRVYIWEGGAVGWP